MFFEISVIIYMFSHTIRVRKHQKYYSMLCSKFDDVNLSVKKQHGNEDVKKHTRREVAVGNAHTNTHTHTHRARHHCWLQKWLTFLICVCASVRMCVSCFCCCWIFCNDLMKHFFWIKSKVIGGPITNRASATKFLLFYFSSHCWMVRCSITPMPCYHWETQKISQFNYISIVLWTPKEISVFMCLITIAIAFDVVEIVIKWNSIWY